MLNVFTDASYIPKQSYSTFSIAYNLKGDESSTRIKIKKVILKDVTCIHAAETYAILSALNMFKNSYGYVDKIKISTDSLYAIRNIVHTDIYKELLAYYNNKGIEIELVKVKAHSGVKMNELADKTARNVNYFLKNHSHYRKKKTFLGWSYC